jgi:hypothetical protein
MVKSTQEPLISCQPRHSLLRCTCDQQSGWYWGVPSLVHTYSTYQHIFCNIDETNTGIIPNITQFTIKNLDKEIPSSLPWNECGSVGQQHERAHVCRSGPFTSGQLSYWFQWRCRRRTGRRRRFTWSDGGRCWA